MLPLIVSLLSVPLIVNVSVPAVQLEKVHAAAERTRCVIDDDILGADCTSDRQAGRELTGIECGGLRVAGEGHRFDTGDRGGAAEIDAAVELDRVDSSCAGIVDGFPGDDIAGCENKGITAAAAVDRVSTKAADQDVIVAVTGDGVVARAPLKFSMFTILSEVATVEPEPKTVASVLRLSVTVRFVA